MEQMNITSAQYSLDLEGNPSVIKAVIDGVETWVPNNSPANCHYAKIMQQVEEGTLVIQEAD